MSVTESLEVVAVQIRIGKVLEQLLKLGQIDRANNLVNVGVHHQSPIDPTLTSLEIEFWRQRHQMAEQKILTRLSDGRDEPISAHSRLDKTTHQVLIH